MEYRNIIVGATWNDIIVSLDIDIDIDMNRIVAPKYEEICGYGGVWPDVVGCSSTCSDIRVHEQKTQNPGHIDAYYHFTTGKICCTTLWTTKSQEGMGSKRYDFPLPDAALLGMDLRDIRQETVALDPNQRFSSTLW